MKIVHIAIVLAFYAAPALAQEREPLSAIDWLSQSVATTPPAAPAARINEPPVTNSADTPRVTVTPLDGPSPDPIGLLPPRVTGLPRSLWAASDEATLVTLVQAERMNTLPAMQTFLNTLMLAEADPPRGAGPDGPLFLARIDKLLDQGAIESAKALLEQADIDSPDLFRRWFDVALLTGTEDRACDVLRTRPEVAPTYPARIFCLARTGDWAAAALTLNTHRVLGDVSPEEEALLVRFLDPELADGDPLPVPARISPLIFRMREAVGEGLTTSSLPRAFAHADLRSTTGWKSQLEAAERLARYGAVSENALLGLYTARTPAASGGIWDRVSAIQALDTALRAGDADKVSAAIPTAWDAMKSAQLEVAFAQMYGDQLQQVALDGPAADIAFLVGLLSPAYETVALSAPADADPFLIALARGIADEATASDDRKRAVKAVYDGAAAPAALQSLVEDGKLGEALLRSLAQFNAGLGGDLASITDALSLMRSVGLEDVVRRAALQLVILDRPT